MSTHSHSGAYVAQQALAAEVRAQMGRKNIKATRVQRAIGVSTRRAEFTAANLDPTTADRHP